MSDKPRFPLDRAAKVGLIIEGLISGDVSKSMIAGSIRRRKETVGDIEILAIPLLGQELSNDMFPVMVPYSKLDRRLGQLVAMGDLEFRITKAGNTVNGEKIKLMRHVGSGIPVDIFTTTPASWFNYLVCRTGSAESNINIAKKAKSLGLKWEPYSSGFHINGSSERIVCKSEQEVFDAVDLPYKRPEDR